MRILFLTQYYPPETGAPQNRLSDLAARLKKAGHFVEVLTALPSYPKGEIYEGYRRSFIKTEELAGIRVVRSWVYATKRKSFVPRILNYLSFAVFSIVVALVACGNVDVVYVESPPLFLGFSGYLVSRIKRARFVLNISDLWPESAVVLGMLRNRRLIGLANWAELWLYRHAWMVTGQTEGIVDSIRERSPNTPTHLITNGVEPEFLEQVALARTARARLKQQFGFGDDFIVAYAGVHGLAQGLDTLLESAALVKHQKEIRFHFFGDGPEKIHLQKTAKEKGTENVAFHPPISRSQIADLLACIDVAIVPLKRDDLFKGALPSKLFEALGAGVPVIAALGGEAEKLMERSQGGIVVEPENPGQMSEAIVRLYADADLRNRLAERGPRFIRAHYNREEIAKNFETLISAKPVHVRSDAKLQEVTRYD